MPRNVEIKYNPYLRRMSVLIDGLEPAVYSGLSQYADEPISAWKAVLIPAIYEEIRDDYYLSFFGTELDSSIIRYFAEQDRHCLRYEWIPEKLSFPTKERLVRMNKAIKDLALTQYGKTIVDAVFCVSRSFYALLPDLLALSIGNLFCTVRCSSAAEEYDVLQDPILFVIADSEDECSKLAERANQRGDVYWIVVDGENSGILFRGDHYILRAASSDQTLEAVFSCLLGHPLQNAIFAARAGMTEKNAGHPDVLQCCLIEPAALLSINPDIEVGRSSRIRCSVIPEGMDCPSVVFRVKDSRIADCNGNYVRALAPGRTMVEAFYPGDRIPFWRQWVSTYTRNRIQNLFLSDDRLCLGCGDSYSFGYSYSPEDADNVCDIQWMSTDSTVAAVNNRGTVTANTPGTSRIICTAENISAICDVIVKPYLETIRCTLSEYCNGTVVMTPGQKLPADIFTEPEDCFDGELYVRSSNYDVVNFVNGSLISKTVGDAEINIVNRTGTKELCFLVMVRNKPEEKSGGFLSRLFGR